MKLKIIKSGLEYNTSSTVQEERTYIVLGAARGGTSLVSGALRLCGVDMGKVLDEANNEDQNFCSHRGDVRTFRNIKLKSAYIKKIKKYIQERNKQSPVWGWKDPLVSEYIRDVIGELRNPLFIFITRDPIAVAMRERIEVPREQAPGLGEIFTINKARDALSVYNKELDIISDYGHPSLLLSYERSLRNSEDFARRMIQFSGAAVNDRSELKILINNIATYTRPDALNGNINISEISSLKSMDQNSAVISSLIACKTISECYTIAANFVNEGNYDAALIAADFIMELRKTGFIECPHLTADTVSMMNVEAGTSFIKAIALINTGDTINSYLSIANFKAILSILQAKGVSRHLPETLIEPVAELQKLV